MFDINAIVNAAITEAVNARITEVLQQHADIVAALAERVAALETKLTEAALFAQTNNVTIPIDEAKMVEALNSQEWFWEKLHNTINDNVVSRVEEAMDDHCSTYDHDSYDNAVSAFEDMPSLDDYVTRDEVRSEIEDVLNNATLSLSI